MAIGLYLPIHLSVPIYVGGMLRAWFDRKSNAEAIERGVLFSSGLIAGEGLVGILLAVFAIIRVSGDKTLGEALNLGGPLGNIGGVVFFLLILAALALNISKKKKAK